MRHVPGKAPPLEAAEEQEFLKLLKQLPVELKVRKLNGLGNRDWPDRMILGPSGFMLLVEMKRKQLGKLSPGQVALFAQLSELEHVVHVFDDGKLAAEFVRQALIDHGVPL